MGTRSLIAVHLDGEYKIAQYSQFDGYPSGSGLDVLEFATILIKTDQIDLFKERVRACRFFTAQEIREINQRIDQEHISNWPWVWPGLYRGTGPNILKIVLTSENGMILKNSIEFAADSLYCEYAWVLDLDAMTFEAFEGFSEEPLSETERFYYLEPVAKQLGHTVGEYHPVKLVAKWSLGKLPTEREFLDTFKSEDDEEE